MKPLPGKYYGFLICPYIKTDCSFNPNSQGGKFAANSVCLSLGKAYRLLSTVEKYFSVERTGTFLPHSSLPLIG
jgi:hypothetical protein